MKYAIYSDGSYKNGIWGAGAVILQETPFGFNPVQELSFFGEDADGIRNVAGEIYGVLEALRLLFKINQSSRDVDSVTVYHDYEGLQKWADGEWKAKKAATQDYRDRVAKARQYLPIQFVKVKAHSSDRLNEKADALAKQGMEKGLKAADNQSEKQPVVRDEVPVMITVNVKLTKAEYDAVGGADGFARWILENAPVLVAEPAV